MEFVLLNSVLCGLSWQRVLWCELVLKFGTSMTAGIPLGFPPVVRYSEKTAKTVHCGKWADDLKGPVDWTEGEGPPAA